MSRYADILVITKMHLAAGLNATELQNYDNSLIGGCILAVSKKTADTQTIYGGLLTNALYIIYWLILGTPIFPGTCFW